MTTIIRSIVLSLLFVSILRVQSFIPVSHARACTSQLTLVADNDDFSTEEVIAMDELIISLSMEPTDESRRQRAVQLFETEMTKPNGSPKRFTDLFDSVLMVVGDRVQMAAKKRALEAGSLNQEEIQEKIQEEATLVDFMQRPADERQLWALVDLMVQTKTLAKKASGKLGNNGSFT